MRGNYGKSQSGLQTIFSMDTTRFLLNIALLSMLTAMIAIPT
uniref:Uncharacterized protein n=1 Tax=Elizabethkingia anophelis TaxID=1117645 RepID=A0A455ZFJ1_9FLAO|nr:TPA_exp: hypothetical protein [Elizabethkingia anophelis]